MSSSIIEPRNAKVWLGEDGIIRVVSHSTPHGTMLADAQATWGAVKSAGAGKVRPLLGDIRNAGSVDSEARRYYSRLELKELISAVALLVGSPLSRVVGSFFLGINRLPVPVKLFTSEEQALKWLKEFLG